jgi:hypothetical protein
MEWEVIWRKVLTIILDPNKVSAIAASVSAIAAALALIGVFFQVYLLVKQLREDMDWKRREKALLFSPVYHDNVEKALQNIMSKLGSLDLRDRKAAVPLKELDKAMKQDRTSYGDMQTVLVYLESVGLAVAHNVADFEIIYDILGTEIIHFCVVFSGYIKRDQTGNPRVWKNIDYLNGQFLKERDRLLQMYPRSN